MSVYLITGNSLLQNAHESTFSYCFHLLENISIIGINLSPFGLLVSLDTFFMNEVAPETIDTVFLVQKRITIFCFI